MTLADRANKAVFADTGYWIAVADPNDGLRSKAQQVAQQCRSRRIVTSELVLVEFLDGMSRRGVRGRRRVVDLIEQINNDPQCGHCADEY